MEDPTNQDPTIQISLMINPELYPDLHEALVPMKKGARSELLRILAQEGLAARQFRAAARARDQATASRGAQD